MEGKKKLGLPSVVATGVGVIVATSCLLSGAREIISVNSTL